MDVEYDDYEYQQEVTRIIYVLCGMSLVFILFLAFKQEKKPLLPM
jgi:uncharacterized membrane protein YuzA (DUF378 family)